MKKFPFSDYNGKYAVVCQPVGMLFWTQEVSMKNER
jgi:hypothetical protein